MNPAQERTHEFLREKCGLDPEASPVSKRNPRPSDQSPYLTISGMSLIGADFRELDLKFASFDECDLSSARFDHCNLFKAKFRNCVLYNASFNGAILVDVDFRGAKLFGVRFGSAKIFGDGDRDLAQLLTRECCDDGRLVYRGTAGRKVWQKAGKDHCEWPRPFLRTYVRYGTNSVDGGVYVSGLLNREIIEIHDLHSNILWSRWRDREKGLDDSFPRPPGDAWPENATESILREYRHCMDRQGRHYVASEARFWEKSYSAASRWRAIQSKILQSNGKMPSYWRRIAAAIPAEIARSFLHPRDRRRKFRFGRDLNMNSDQVLGKREKPPRDRPRSADKEHRGKHRDNNRILFGAPNFTSFFTFLKQLLALYLFIGLFLWILSNEHQLLAVLLIAPPVLTFLVMLPKKLEPEDSRLGIFKDIARDLVRACREYIQHVVCGSGERPFHGIVSLIAWVALFGILFNLSAVRPTQSGEPQQLVEPDSVSSQFAALDSSRVSTIPNQVTVEDTAAHCDDLLRDQKATSVDVPDANLSRQRSSFWHHRRHCDPDSQYRISALPPATHAAPFVANSENWIGNGNEKFNIIDGFYVSVVTATTLGYGDFSPGSRTISFLVSVEVIGGLLLFSLLTASLVSKAMSR
ncbi:MAG: pentapeptide repeat-containing protein [bacterium]